MTPARAAAWRCAALTRQHWLLTVLLAAGLVLRVITQIAYRPAILYIDSLKYLYHADGADPVGYRVLLEPLLLVGNLDVVVAVQHLLGLAMAVTLYAVLLRRGTPRWLAALATAPILLDAYQLQIEQNIMPDVMFEVLIVAGLTALLWHERSRLWLLAAAGLALGASATVRQVGEILILPALIYVVISAGGWRRCLANAAVLCVAFAVPILSYCTVALADGGHFRLAYAGSDGLYGRLVLATDCAHVALPAYERPLCASRAEAATLGGIDGLDHNPYSPLWTSRKADRFPPGMTWSAAVGNFNQRLLASDPAGVLTAIGRSALTLFAVDRNTSPGDTAIKRWQFQSRHYPYEWEALYSSKITPKVVARAGRKFGSGGPGINQPLASFLRTYQLDGGYTPGPLLAFCAISGLTGSLAALRRRSAATGSAADDWPVTGPCLLFFTAAVSVLIASDLFEFSWRYQLPALVTLPPAGALAVVLAMRHFRHRTS